MDQIRIGRFIAQCRKAGGLTQRGGVVLGSQKGRMTGIGFHSLFVSAHSFSPFSSDSNSIPFLGTKIKQKKRAEWFPTEKQKRSSPQLPLS